MKIVSRFEASLLTIARAVTGQVGLDEALVLLRREHKRPTCLGRTAIELLQDSLAKGVVERLATWGWRDERYLFNAQVIRGRLWDRALLHSQPLAFSPATLEFLIWLTAEDVYRPALKLKTPLATYTLADHLVVLMAVIALWDTQPVEGLLSQHVVQQHPLVQLCFPEAFTDRPPSKTVAFDPWLSPAHAWILEALQPLLAARWLHVESSKRRMSDRLQMIRYGQREHAHLVRYLNALEAAGRRDLARFLLVMGGRLLLQPHPEWFANLEVHGVRLNEREHAYRAGLAVISELSRLARWQDDATAIGYYDEGYAASQLFKSNWETLRGAEICAAAAALTRHYTSLQQWESAT